MITENKTIRVRTEYTPQAKKELNAPARKTANKMIFGGLGFAVLAVVLLFVFYYFKKDTLTNLSFALFIAAMLFLLVSAAIKQSIKKELLKPIPPTVYDYEFYNGGIAAKEEVNGEVLHVSKYYDKAIIKTLEGERYMFLFVAASLALVIDKTLLSPPELATIKAIYFKQYSGERLDLPEFRPGTPQFVQPVETTKIQQD